MKTLCKRKAYLRRESGAVLIVGLVMVLLISIVALSAIRSSNMQEAMAGNLRDRNIAFQAAESALAVGEAQVNIFAVPPLCTGQTTCFLRSARPYPPPQDSVIYLDDNEFDLVSRESQLVLAGVAKAPTYMIEELTQFVPSDGSGLEQGGGGGFTRLVPYRITARGVGLGAGTSVILQSTYNTFSQ